MNIKPAPFVLTGPVVAMALAARAAKAGPIALVPVVSTKLVDEVPGITGPADVSGVIRPDCTFVPAAIPEFAEPSARTDGREEPARVAPVLAAPSAPVEFPNLDRPDIAKPWAAPKREKIALPAPRDDVFRVQAAPRKTIKLPPLAADVRRAELEAATRFLMCRGILVTVIDRDELVRRYRVTRRGHAFLHEDVIAFAASLGFESNAEG